MANRRQLLAKIPKSVHDEFHALLREELRTAGFNIPFGRSRGSASDWIAHFKEFPGSQGKAFNAVLKAARAVDVKHGTEIAQWVGKNLVGKNYLSIS